MDYDDDGTLELFGYIGDKHQSGLGVSTTVESPQADRLRRVSVVTPAEDGSTTFTFPTQDFLRFMALPQGASDTSLTLDEQYELSISRDTQTQWTYRVAPGPKISDQASEAFQSASLTIGVDRLDDTWRSIVLDVQIDGTDLSISGHLELTATTTDPPS